MSKGFIPIRRTLFDHFLFKEKRIFSRFEAWLDLIQLASFKDENSDIVAGKLVTKDRGEVVASLRYLATRWNWSMHKVSNYLELLNSRDMTIVGEENGITKITLKNFNKHNSINSNNVVDEKEETQKRTAGSGVGTDFQLFDKKNIKKGNTKRNAETPDSIEVDRNKGTPKGTLGEQRGNSEGTNSNKVNKDKNDNGGPKQIDFLKREKEFYSAIALFVNDYPKGMLREFYDYWREPNKSKTKMKFELQETWELKLRLIKWESNQVKFNKGQTKKEINNGAIGRKIQDEEGHEILAARGGKVAATGN